LHEETTSSAITPAGGTSHLFALFPTLGATILQPLELPNKIGLSRPYLSGGSSGIARPRRLGVDLVADGAAEAAAAVWLRHRPALDQLAE
jgi:hypothetical protein